MNPETKTKRLFILSLLRTLKVCTLIQIEVNKLMRRWWTKPHLRENERANFGLYSTIYPHLKNNDHEGFYKFIGMSVNQFQYLLDLVQAKLEKVSYRTPLPSELRLIITLK